MIIVVKFEREPLFCINVVGHRSPRGSNGRGAAGLYLPPTPMTSNHQSKTPMPTNVSSLQVDALCCHAEPFQRRRVHTSHSSVVRVNIVLHLQCCMNFITNSIISHRGWACRRTSERRHHSTANETTQRSAVRFLYQFAKRSRRWSRGRGRGQATQRIRQWSTIRW